jgi:nucleotide-binding universal stress UspA family protein
MFKNILVPTDGSTLSYRAIKRAVQLAKEQKSRVTGFYVGPAWDSKPVGDAVLLGFVNPQQHAANVKKTADGFLGVVRKAAAAAGVPCKCFHAEGSYPYEKIVKAAQDNRCDLIVMASHGRRGISKLLLGSETAKVLAHSTVPVMVCR